MCGCDEFEPIERFDAALRLACFGRLGAEAVNIALQMRDVALLLGVLCLLLEQTLGARAFKLSVVAAIAGQGLLRDLNRVRTQRVEKIAVVRDDELGCGMAFQILLQPQHSVQIQMVGRFIQQQ